MWRNPPPLDDQKFWLYMQDAYVDLAEPVLTLATEAGASYYEMAGGDPVVADITPEEALRKTARWAMAKGNATTGLQLLSGSLEGHIYSAAQDSVQQSAEAEPGATWARRARQDACPWCRMVATRGDVYASARAATQHSGVGRHRADQNGYHDFCRCLGVAVRPGQVYRPPAYVQEWEEQYKEITRQVGTNPAAVVNAWEALINGEDLNFAAAGSGKYDDPEYLAMTPDQKKRERARRRRLAAKEVAEPKKEPVRKKSPRHPRAGEPGFSKPPVASVSHTVMKEPPKLDRPDSYARAWFHRSNPKYREAKAYQVNCQRAVQAYELRRRGYNVTAAGNYTYDGETSARKLNWNRPVAETFWPGAKFQDTSSWDDLNKQLNGMPVGARGFIATRWRAGGGHVFSWEKTARGLQFMDAQTWEGDEDFMAKMKRQMTWTNTQFIRLDDREPDWQAMGKYDIFEVDGKPW